ncbi:MAG: MASE1 domain-containing protein [Microcystaceae cyanobacterium]
MLIPTVQQKSYLGNILMVAIAYFLSGFLPIILLRSEVTVSPFWLPAGIGLGILIFSNINLLWGIFIGDFFLMLYLGESQLIALLSAVVSTSALAFAIILLRRYHFSPSLNRLRDAIALVLIGAIIIPLTNGSIYHLMKGIFTEFKHDILSEWLLLWLGDCTAVLIITPLICYLKTDRWRQTLFHVRKLEGISCFSLLIAVSWLVFAAPISSQLIEKGGLITAQYLEYLPFPFLVWASLRFQTFGAILASLIVAIFAIVGTLQGLGAFALQTPDPYMAILLLQIFITLITTTALLLASSVTERKKITEKLEQNLEEDRLLAKIASNIRQSLELDTILETTVKEIQQLVNTDRTYIGYLTPDDQLQVLAEIVNPPYLSLKGWHYPEGFLQDIESVLYSEQTIVNNQLGIVKITPAIQDFLDTYEIKASLIVPLQINNHPLGILVVHQCAYHRQWKSSERQLLEKLATHVSIAIHQAQLYQQVQQLNSNLEEQVEERTTQLADKVEELQQFYDMRTIFLQGVSHDLKTSMMGLSMLLNHLQSPAKTEISLSPKLLKQMMESCDRSLTLINALSEEQLAQKIPIDLNITSINSNDFIMFLIPQWQSLLDTYQATLIPRIETNLPAINIDIVELQKVFFYLLQNAVKHNPPHQTITIEVKRKENEIECAIADNGIGLTEQQQAQLFKLYVRSLHNNHLTGIGLGCYQARQIIEAHGGKIGVESQLNQGTRIWFTLPIIV